MCPHVPDFGLGFGRRRTVYSSPRMKKKAYAAAGVDIDLGNQVKSTLPQLLASTHRREVLGKVGGFGMLATLGKGNKLSKPALSLGAAFVSPSLTIDFDFPTARVSRCVPPIPATMPRLISGWPNFAVSAAMMKSQSIASSQPPPRQ